MVAGDIGDAHHHARAYGGRKGSMVNLDYEAGGSFHGLDVPYAMSTPSYWF